MKKFIINKLPSLVTGLLVLATLTNCVQNAADSISSSGTSSTTTYTASLVGSPSLNVGKSVFQVKLTDATGAGKAGLNPLIVPTMDMGTILHTTPVDTIVDNGSGNYTVTAYFIMASMGGTWYLKFYDSTGANQIASALTITVGGMSSARISASEATDQYNQMGTATNRPYFLFIDSVTGATGNHTVNIFAATRKTLMLHPALATGLALTPFTGVDWNVTTLALTISTDGGTTYTALTNNGSGKFSLSGIAGLTSGNSVTLRFKTTVNGTVKNVGVNDYGTLTVTMP